MVSTHHFHITVDVSSQDVEAVMGTSCKKVVKQLLFSTKFFLVKL